MEIQIDQARLKDIRKAAEEMYYKQYKDVLEQEISVLFRKRIIHSGGTKHGTEYQSEGAVRTLIKKQVEDFFLSEKTQARAAGYIDEIFNPALDACVKDALSHATRKTNFNPLVDRAKQELSI